MRVLHCTQSRCIIISCKTYYEITDTIREELIESQLVPQVRKVITLGEHSRQSIVKNIIGLENTTVISHQLFTSRYMKIYSIIMACIIITFIIKSKHGIHQKKT